MRNKKGESRRGRRKGRVSKERFPVTVETEREPWRDEAARAATAAQGGYYQTV